MSPKLALSVYDQRATRQLTSLPSYDAIILIHADVPSTRQQASFELYAQYLAPAALRFTPIRFNGDRFVRTHIINRYLQREAQQVEKQDRAATAIVSANYHFNYRRTESAGSTTIHVYAVKPRRKAHGLFKGEVSIDARSGRLRRTTGAVKSTSFFVRDIQFQQDYADVGDFTVPIHLHLTATARIIGRIVVDVVHNGYVLMAQNNLPPEVSSLP